MAKRNQKLGTEDAPLSALEFANVLRVDVRTIYKRIKDGDLVARRFGKIYFIPRSELAKFMSADDGDEPSTNAA